MQEHRRRGGKNALPHGLRERWRESEPVRARARGPAASEVPADRHLVAVRKMQGRELRREIREQAEIEVRAKIRAQFEQGKRKRRAEEEAAGADLIEQEIRAGRMKRCVSCRAPIEKAGGCDHMHCRGAGGCGAHFCFACDATPSTEPECPGRGV